MSAKRPTVLVVTSTYPRHIDDTLPRFVHELCRRLNADLDIHVLAPSTPGVTAYEQMDGVHVHRFRYCLRRFETIANVDGFLPALKAAPWRALLLPFFFASEVWAIGKLTRHYGVQLIHAHWIVPQGFAVWLARRLWRLSSPSVVTCHGADIFALNNRFFRLLKKVALEDAAAVTAVSQAGRTQALAFGARSDTTFVYPMGVDLANLFAPTEDVEREQFTVLFVGRLSEKKGVSVLIRALALAREEIPELKAEIVGYGPDEKSLKALAAELSVADIVNFRGAAGQQALAQFYSRASCLVFPSIVARSGDQEGLPLVPVEALGCACPVIASAIAGVQEIIQDGRTGWLFKPGDSHELADKIVHVLRNRSNSLGIARVGRAAVNVNNDWTHATQNYLQLFRSTLDRTYQGDSSCRPSEGKTPRHQ